MAATERGDVIRAGLGQLGKHPLLLSHVYLELKVPRSSPPLESVEILANYPHLMYVDVSDNRISDLRVLGELPTLVQLNASRNCLTECLDFCPPRCTDDDAWSSGDKAVGSMLTLANLSFNKISELVPGHLGAHPFLETLLLSHNHLDKIQGLQSLKFLQVLDLSNNNIAAIQGLSGLRIQELNLEGNRLTSATGLADLPHLSVLNLSHNKIRSLSALSTCSKLLTLNVGHNDLQMVAQTRFLQDIPWLAFLTLAGNACCGKTNYRCRVLVQLRNLRRLDALDVTAEELVRTCNLYGIEGGDLAERRANFAHVFPGEHFEDCPSFGDDEEGAALEEDEDSSEVGIAKSLASELFHGVAEGIIESLSVGAAEAVDDNENIEFRLA